MHVSAQPASSPSAVTLLALVLCTARDVDAGAPPRARPPALLGHRGALMSAPENTLSAFALCLAAAVDIELDVYPTSDGELVVIHDPTVDRTTDGAGRVADLTLEQIRTLDAGSWFHSDFAGERVPTLGQALRLVVERERRATVVAINLKPVNQAVLAGVVGAVREAGLFERSFVFDLSLENARRFKDREPRLRCAASAMTAEAIREAVRLDFIDVIWTNPKPKALVDEIHASGKQVYFTLVNDAAGWLRAKADGVDGICTNYPLEMKAAGSPPPVDRMWDHYLTPEQRPRYRLRRVE